MTSGLSVTDGAAWRSFCDRLAVVGESILAGDLQDERTRVEGFHHLATQVVTWLAWSAGHHDLEHPAFFRQNDLVSCWGGPNVNQVTRRTRVVPTGRYVIRGRMHACDDLVVTVKGGDMHMDRYDVLAELMASDVDIGRDDEVEIFLGGAPLGDGVPWLPLPSGSSMLNIREYYWTWTAEEPAVMTVHRLDTVGISPEALTGADVAEMLDEAATIVEQSMRYWAEWMETQRNQVGVNSMGAPYPSDGGSSFIRYGFGFYELQEDEVFLIESEIAECAYWDIQLYTPMWFESPDFANRVTSLNHTQAHLSSDGRFRAVVAHSDPGVPNWLDTSGRPSGMVTYRWIRGLDAPAARGRVISLAELADHLPVDTPTVTPAKRADEIAVRQEHVAWRYRT